MTIIIMLSIIYRLQFMRHNLLFIAAFKSFSKYFFMRWHKHRQKKLLFHYSHACTDVKKNLRCEVGILGFFFFCI